MEDATKNKRGRPSLDSTIANGFIAEIAAFDQGQKTARSYQNQYYEVCGNNFILQNQDSIPFSNLIVYQTEQGQYNKARAVSEQIGRMTEAGYSEDDLLILCQYAAQMLKAGYTVKQTANFLRRGKKEGFTNGVDFLEAATNISLSYKEIALAAKYFEILRALLNLIEQEKQLGRKSAIVERCEKFSIDYEEDAAALLKLQKVFDAKLNT